MEIKHHQIQSHPLNIEQFASKILNYKNEHNVLLYETIN